MIAGAVGVGGDVVVLLGEGVGGGPAGVGGGEEARAEVVGAKALVRVVVVVLLHRARGGVLHAGRKADAVVFDGEGIDNNHKRG